MMAENVPKFGYKPTDTNLQIQEVEQKDKLKDIHTRAHLNQC